MEECAIRRRKVAYPPHVCVAAATAIILCQARAEGCIGSRLVWNFGWSLLSLNLFIGGFEGFVGFALFRVRFARAAGIMILANYFSLIAGYPLLSVVTQALERLIFSPPRILYLRNLVLLTVGVSFVLTVVLELPFCLWLFKGKTRRAARAAAFCLVSQMVVYAFLGPKMRDWVSTSVYDLEVAADTTSTRNPDTVVYYLENGSGDLWCVRLDGSEHRFVAHTKAGAEQTLLFPVPDEETKAWKLMGVTPSPYSEECVLEIFEPLDCEAMETSKSVYAGCYDELHAGGPLAFDFSDPYSSGTHSHRVRGRGRTAWDVIVNKKERTGHSFEDEEYRLFYQTPFRFYIWDVPSVLPEDEAVVSVDGQVLLLDVSAKRLSFLVEGRSPFVVPAGTVTVGAAAREDGGENAAGT